MSRITLRLLSSALLVPLLATQPGHAQIRLQIQGRVQIGGAIVAPNAAGRRSSNDDGLSTATIFVEERAVSNALHGARARLERIDGLEGPTRITLLQQAIGHLQQVLDLDGDFNYRPTEDDRSKIRSAKGEAERMIVGLPRDGRELYESEFGPTARARLDRAIAESRVAGIEDVVQRYFHTEAGYEATYRLGSFYLDHGEPLAAALVFQRLRDVGVETWEPMLSLKTAVAWGRAGMQTSSIDTLVEFRARTRGDAIEIGGERVPLFADRDEALPWLTGILGRTPNFETLGREQWTMFRGDPARTATTRPASPLWDVRWRYSTIERPGDNQEERLTEVLGEYKSLEEKFEDRDLFVQPAMHPLVVGNTVVFRTLYNVRALDLASGETIWESYEHDRTFDEFLKTDAAPPQVQNVNGRQIVLPVQQRNGTVAVTPMQKFLAQRAWSDLTAGTLSSDGKFVYCIEDLGFLDGFNTTTNGIVIPATASSDRPHNKLMAVDLRSGRLVWEIGGPGNEADGPFAGAYFLGPPLPLDNKLYVLLERAGEIQLAVLEWTPRSPGPTQVEFPLPRVLWTQSLITPAQDLNLAPLRRLAGLTPSYGDGVMVCPTASGAVVAVDLARRQLAWGHRYQSATPAIPGNPFVGRAVNVASLTGNDDEDRWLDSAPTIAEGYVVVTPRDSGELHCIDLATEHDDPDGDLEVWSKPRRDGLYVAGVHDGHVVVVGRSQVRALSLADGSDVWADPIPIGLPAGRGVQAGSLYHVPLREGGIVTIDLAGGRLLATAKSSDGHVPGNLVAAAGGLVSLSPSEVIAFEPLSVVDAEVDGALDANPNDVSALTRRGALRLHQGREEAALADLQRAIDAGAGEATRELFVATLLEGLRLDFAKYRDRAANSVALIDDLDQMRAYLRLHARGLEQVGETEQAFAEYVELAGLRTGRSRLERATGQLAVRGDRWIRPRLVELFATAPPRQRRTMETTLEREIAAATAADDPDRLRQLTSALGQLNVAVATRRALIAKLDPVADAVERTLLLERMRTSDDEATAAYATATLASAALETGRLADAVVWFDDLTGRFADVACLDDRTGGQLVAEWSAREDVRAFRAAANPWPATPMVVENTNGQNGILANWPVAAYGSPGPFYERWTFTLDNGRQNLVARNDRGLVAWQVPVQFDDHVISNIYGYFVRTKGHLVVACFGTYFVVIDPLHEEGQPQIVWSRSLNESADNTANMLNTIGPVGHVVTLVDAARRPRGTVGAVTGEAVYYQVGTRLYAADLLTGDLLWELRNVDRGAVVRADDEYVVVVQNDESHAMVLRADDGRLVADRRVIPPAGERAWFEGRRVLGWTRTRNGARRLAMRDVVTGNEIWAAEANGAAWLSEMEGDEIAIREQDGRFRILRIADGTPLVQATLPAVTSSAGITVLRLADRYLLLPNDPSPNPSRQVRFNGLGIIYPIVNGDVVAFDRGTGREMWRTTIEGQSMPLGQPSGPPLIVLAARSIRLVQQPARGVNTNQYSLAVLDTRNGKLVFEETGTKSVYPFTLEANADEQTLELAFEQRHLDIHFEKPGDVDGTERNGNAAARAEREQDDSDDSAAEDVDGTVSVSGPEPVIVPQRDRPNVPADRFRRALAPRAVDVPRPVPPPEQP